MGEKFRDSGNEKKQAEEIPDQRKQYFRSKPEDIFSLPGETADLELAEIIDVKAIQSLMDDFYKLTKIPIGLNDLKGYVLAGAGWQEICYRFHRAHPEASRHCLESDIKLSRGISPGEFKVYRCKNNMLDIVTPIMVGSRHIGYIFAGQFFFEDEPPNYEIFRAQAKKYGFDEQEYINALEKVPRLSRETVNTGLSFLLKLASMISQLSYGNIKLAQSLTERNTLVDALQENRTDFARAQEVGNIGSWRMDVRKNKLTWSEENHRIFGIPKGTPLTYETFLSTVHPEDREYVDKKWKAGLEGEPYDIEHRIIADGKTRWVREKAYLEFDIDETPIGGFGITQDITERKKAEEALKKAHDNLEELVQERTEELEKAYNSLKKSEKGLAEAQKMAHIGNWEWDTATGKLYWSDELYRIFGLKFRESGLSYKEFLSYVHPEDRDYVNKAIRKSMFGKTCNIEFRIVSADGTERLVHAQNKVSFNEKSTPVRMRGIVQDITERKRTEETLRNIEIARKKEIHHRIKNNLQVIFSLLDLQAEQFKNRECINDSEVLKAFRESQNRVMSIALIHEELHEGKGGDALNFSVYLRRLINSLFQTYRFGNPDIGLKMDLEEDIIFDMDTAVPLGMIVNELVSNSLKHAFPGRITGEIRIKLFCENEGDKLDNKREAPEKGSSYILIVSDNGIGIPKEIGLENSDTLGLQLVNLLAAQLDGDIELERDNGTEFIVKISDVK